MLIRVNRKVKKALILSLSLAAVIPSIQALSVNPDATSNGFGNSSFQYISQQNGEWKNHPDNDGSICYLYNGEMMKNYWYQNPNNGHVRYLNEKGKMVTNSWPRHPDNDGSRCYIDLNGLMAKKAWIPSISGAMRYVDENGKMVKNDWAYNAEKNQHYYLGNDGKIVTNAIVAHRDNDGSQCFVNNIGVIARNYWYYDREDLYYFNADGKMVKNDWVYNNNIQNECYLGNDGKIVTNNIVPHRDNDGSQCLVDEKGIMYRNYWYYDREDLYYFNADGKMVKNDWVYNNNIQNECYLGNDGKRVTNSIIDHPDNDGSHCFISNIGVIARDYWYYDRIDHYYFDRNGKMVKNDWVYSNILEGKCYFGNDGKRVTNSIIDHPDDDGSLCIVGDTGVMSRDYWKTIEGNTYYFDINGKMVKNQWVITDRGNRRFLNGNGVLIKNQWIKHPDYENSLCYVNNYGNMLKEDWISHPFYDSVICFVGYDGVVSEYLLCTLGENGQIIEDQIDNPSLYPNMDLNNIQPNQEQDVNTMEEDEPYPSFDLNADSDDERLMELE